jgi:hypothetical protein
MRLQFRRGEASYGGSMEHKNLSRNYSMQAQIPNGLAALFMRRQVVQESTNQLPSVL